MSDEEDLRDDMDADDERAEGDEDGEEGEGGGGINAKKIVLFVVVPLFLLIGAGAGLYFTGMLDGLLGKGDAAHADAEGGDSHAAASSHGGGHGDGHGGASAAGVYFLEIPNIRVNINSDTSKVSYLSLTVQLELATEGDKAAVEAVMPRVVDQFQTYLRELNVRDLRGSAGIYRLQMELLSRVNAAAYPTEVKDVLFQEILVQ